MWNKIKIRPAGDKSRFGNRGKKVRYAVFKAQWNQKWAPFEENECRKLCEKHGADPEAFINKDDNPNRKWCYALMRAEKVFHERTAPYPKHKFKNF